MHKMRIRLRSLLQSRVLRTLFAPSVRGFCHVLGIVAAALPCDVPQPAAKEALRDRMRLSKVDAPIVGVVTRLTHQKGIHLIKHAAWRTLERGGQFVLLGSAPDPRVQGEFDALAREIGNQYHDRARLHFAFDEPLSHLIYAGADIMLVPSMFEPCGLTQMIGMRYGTVPVARKTGGLADTVFDVDHDTARATELDLAVCASAAAVGSEHVPSHCGPAAFLPLLSCRRSC